MNGDNINLISLREIRKNYKKFCQVVYVVHSKMSHNLRYIDTVKSIFTVKTYLFTVYLCPPRMLRGGNVFKGVCQSPIGGVPM